MVDQKNLINIAEEKMISIFGEQFINEQNGHFCKSAGECMDNVFLYFAGFYQINDNQNLTPNKKGWKVFFEVYIAKDTGEILNIAYQTESGKSKKSDWD